MVNVRNKLFCKNNLNIEICTLGNAPNGVPFVVLHDLLFKFRELRSRLKSFGDTVLLEYYQVLCHVMESPVMGSKSTYSQVAEKYRKLIDNSVYLSR